MEITSSNKRKREEDDVSEDARATKRAFVLEIEFRNLKREFLAREQQMNVLRQILHQNTTQRFYAEQRVKELNAELLNSKQVITNLLRMLKELQQRPRPYVANSDVLAY